MEGSEFLKPESMHTIMAWRFPIWYFLSISLSGLMYFSFCPSSSPSNTFSMLFIHSAFLLCFLRCAIFCPQIALFPYHPVVGLSSCNLFLLEDRIFFHCFGSSNCIVCFTYVAYSFLSQHVLEFFLCLIIFTCCRRFLICISSQISQPGFEFLLVFWEEPRFFHILISLLHRLVCLIP